eukprot:15480987-Alexandrium_andersonii.AAC.1
MEAGPVDPKSLRPSAGVAALARRAARLTPLEAADKHLRQAVSYGRFAAYLVDTGAGYPLRVFNVYAWLGYETRARAREQISLLFAALMRELADSPDAPLLR